MLNLIQFKMLTSLMKVAAARKKYRSLAESDYQNDKHFSFTNRRKHSLALCQRILDIA